MRQCTESKKNPMLPSKVVTKISEPIFDVYQIELI